MRQLQAQRAATSRGAFSSGSKPVISRKAVKAVCSATAQEGASRRDVLVLTGATILAAAPALAPPPAAADKLETKYIAVDQLASFQRVAQRKEITRRTFKYLGEVLTAADAPATIALVLHDAGTYDFATKTGGLDGSIVLSSEELNRPENAYLKPTVAKLAAAKAKIDEEGATIGQGPISWADLLVLAAKFAVQAEWRDIKASRAQDTNGAAILADKYAADWPVKLGRIDSSEPAPAGRLPGPDASVQEVKAYLAQLGAKPGQGGDNPFAAKPPFWSRPAFVVWTAGQINPSATEAQFAAADPEFAEIKTKYDASRVTLTRTDYEVDFITFFTRLTDLGAKFDKSAYLYPEAVQTLKF